MATSELDEIRAIERKWQDRWFGDKIFEPKSAGPEGLLNDAVSVYERTPAHRPYADL